MTSRNRNDARSPSARSRATSPWPSSVHGATLPPKPTLERDVRRRRRRALAACALLWGTLGAWACEAVPEASDVAPAQVAGSTAGVVVAAQPLAAEAGAQMLRSGGNAADAAVAAAFAVSVVEPSMNSIGGRTQILVRLPDGTFSGIDATTQAPSTYDPDTAPQASYGYPTVGVPGAVRGLALLLERHGALDLGAVMAPAIALAEDGFRLLEGEARRHEAGADQLAEFEGSRAHFLDAEGRARSAGDLFAQPDLAATLRAIAEGGAEAFYTGPIARRIAADMAARGGAVTEAALAEYRALDATVVRGSYRGRELVGTGLPASGALTIGILHVLENFDLASLDGDDWAALVGTVVARAFEERTLARAREPASLEFMTDKAWARSVAADVDVAGVEPNLALSQDPRLPGRAPGRLVSTASPAPAASPGVDGWGRVVAGAPEWATAGAGVRERAAVDWDGSTWGEASGHTTHLSTADGRGMYVSLTQTIGPNLGSKVATPGLGFLHAATLGGYLGRMEPGERASSSISPLMVLEDGEPLLVLGAAGGARIVSAVVQATLRVIDQGMSLPDALAAARVHPADGGISMETSPGVGWTDEDVAQVEARGIEVREIEAQGAFGRVHGIWVDRRTGETVGVADPDWEGAAVVPGG